MSVNLFRHNITPVGGLMFDLYRACWGCSDGYLQQHANYANEAPVWWDLKRLFVLPLLRGETGVGAGGGGGGGCVDGDGGCQR